MKRRLLIFSSLITLLLSCFSFPIFAEETVQDSSNLHSLSDGVFLDSYFYENYDLLPYLESNGSQYIDTGIFPSENIVFSMKFSGINEKTASNVSLFGSVLTSNTYLGNIDRINNRFVFAFTGTSISTTALINNLYYIHDLTIDKESLVLDGKSYVINLAGLNSNVSIYLFSRNPQSTIYNSVMKLYSCSFYDQSINNGEGGYVRYYYPAKAKSSGTLGLYDAVNKTFISSLNNNSFNLPENDQVMNYQISSFLYSCLGWINQIFVAIIQIPIVIIFIAVSIAGVMFRWGKRIIHL